MRNKQTTRIFPLRAWLAIACLCFPTTGLADGFLEDDLSYQFESGSDTHVCVWGLKNSSATHIVIPSTVVYEWTEKDSDGEYQTRSRTCSVTRIRDHVFNGHSLLTSVTIPASVTRIGSSAFSGCSSLASVTIPDGVTNIEERTFYGCSSLASATIGNSVTSIGKEAFSYCTSLASVTIPDSVTSIGQDAFSYCTSLASVTIPDSVTSIGQYAFSSCSSLAFITIPDSVTSIGNGAFSGCTSLASVTIPDSVTSIGTRAFYGCGSLTAFSVSAGNPIFESVNGLLLTNDGKTLFHGVNRSDVTIPNGVTNVCEWAFHNCADLRRLVIPDSVVTLATSAFDGCDKLWTSWYRTLANQAAGGGGSGGGGSSGTRISLTVTNVVLHYVTQSVPSGAVVPPLASGLVNVVTEVGAGRAVAIPSEWAEQYPGFAAKFGNDFREAVTKPTGKRDGSGNPMSVWQDFVAGTDPTDESDVFTASLTFDAATGEPVVSWSPELSATEAAKRVYTVFGKVRLTDTDWTLVNGDAADYNFFKVHVEMR